MRILKFLLNISLISLAIGLAYSNPSLYGEDNMGLKSHSDRNGCLYLFNFADPRVFVQLYEPYCCERPTHKKGVHVAL